MKTNEYNNMNFKQVDIYYKILLIGPRKVGKTQILRRICKEDFNENYSPSFGIDFRILKYHSENLVVQLIELAGKAGISSEIIKDYIIESDCFICVYDITNMDTFTELNYWFDSTKDIINEKTVMGIVGNKSDLFLKEEVKESDARELAKQKGFEFALTSAKDPLIFCEFLEKLVKKYLGEEVDDDDDDKGKKKKDKLNLDKAKPKTKKSCC